jgi:hypothetical protein
MIRTDSGPQARLPSSLQALRSAGSPRRQPSCHLPSATILSYSEEPHLDSLIVVFILFIIFCWDGGFDIGPRNDSRFAGLLQFLNEMLLTKVDTYHVLV